MQDTAARSVSLQGSERIALTKYSAVSSYATENSNNRSKGTLRLREEKNSLFDFIKSIVFGGVDGILAAMVVISGAVGGGLSWPIVLIIGASSAIAGGIKMGVDEYLSSRAHREFVKAAKRRERWQFQNYRGDEIAEMVNKFKERGMASADAEVVVEKMSAYENFFVSLMVAEELGLQLPEDNDAVLITDAFVMLLSYAGFAAIPLFIYMLAPVLLFSDQTLFTIAIVLALFVLFALGSAKSYFSGGSVSWIYSGFEAIAVGVTTSVVSYFVGRYASMLA